MDGLSTTLGIKIGSAVGGFLGALVSLKFIEGQSMGQRVSTVFAGTAGATYLAPLVAGWLDTGDKLEAGLAFLIGVIFMSMAGAFIKAIPEWIAAAKSKWLGG